MKRWYVDAYESHGALTYDILEEGGGIIAELHDGKERAPLIAESPTMLQLLRDIDAASWVINSSLGGRIRESIKRAEGTTK